jgi:methionyl aminopeptidase
LVHGIVNDYVLKDGDVVSCDFGATYNGAVADAARTWIYKIPKSSEHVRLLKTCKEVLFAGAQAIKIGNRVGSIGFAIDKIVKKSGFGLITNYGGHGLGISEVGKGIPHASPFIFNKSTPMEGIMIQYGLAIAIEPMMTIGEPKTKTLDDGWTVVTPGISCHFENTYTIMEDGVHIITEIPNED